ncbi:MAG TPA: hypothetical protein VD995_11730 [Azospirillum sp.]|nr:hypothetical protein [Azospirillum sp.]
MTHLPDQIAFLDEVCRRRGYRMTILDEHSAYLIAVSDGTREFVTGAGMVNAYPINNATAATIATDKAHTYTLARRAGFRVPRGGHFFVTRRFRDLRAPGREIHDAVLYAQSLGFPVFVKPNDGSRGAHADIVHDENDLIHHCAAMAAEHSVALVQEVLHGVEFRIVAVDGEALFLYRRDQGGLVGDGVSTVGDLVAAANARLVGEGLTPVSPDASYLREALKQAGLDLAGVPPAGFVLPITARRNISGGGRVSGFATDMSDALRDYVRRLSAVVGLRVCGIDVFSRTAEPDPDGFTLLEVNANPSLSGVAKAGHREEVLRLWERVCALRFAEAPP